MIDGEEGSESRKNQRKNRPFQGGVQGEASWCTWLACCPFRNEVRGLRLAVGAICRDGGGMLILIGHGNSIRAILIVSALNQGQCKNASSWWGVKRRVSLRGIYRFCKNEK